MFNNIGEVITFIRKESGLRQETLANRAGLNKSTIIKIENNQRSLSLEEAIRISEVLSLDINTLYSYIKEQCETEKEDLFLWTSKLGYVDGRNLDDIKRVELLVDALFTQEEIYREQ